MPAFGSLATLVGGAVIPGAQRALLAVAAVLVMAVPLPAFGAVAPDPLDASPATRLRMAPVEVRDPDRPATERFVDRAGVAITPPNGWIRSPATSLNPVSDPPEPVQEVARFQMRLLDPQLYAAPIPITSGLVADAGAVISIGVAREGSDILSIDRTVRGTREFGTAGGFVTLDDEATYEGLHVLTRYLFSRSTDRVLVARAAADEASWSELSGVIGHSLQTFGGDPKGANAPAPPAPPPPPPPPPPVDETVAVRNTILARAASLLGLRYVWGGNSTSAGMDCSAYVSWAWAVSRYTTDSIWNVSFPIAKADLRPGDALNLTTGRDPQHLGHIRIFEAWANAEHSAIWVYEETPPRVVHRVVAYDDRYQPVRLAGLSGAGEASVVPGAPAPEPAAARRPGPAPTRRPAPRPTTPRPTTRGPTATRPPTPRAAATPTLTGPSRTPSPTPHP